MTDIWQAGKTYVPGSLVRPSAVPAPQFDPIANGGFESGDLTGWTPTMLPANWSINTHPYAGTYSLWCKGGGIATIISATRGTVMPGTSVTAQAVANFHNNGTDDMGCQLALYWYDASDVFLSASDGATLTGQGGVYKGISVTGAAPAGAKYVRAVIGCNTGSHGGDINFDQVSWAYTYAGAPAGLIYKATQASPGKSGTSEPAWPNATGIPVTDNEVTWEGFIASRVVWEASPILLSGGTEPVWPDTDGGMVRDGTIDWTAVTPRVTDVQCPHTKIVAVAANKVFAGDSDVVRFCATNNAMDWSALQDAGYLPTGLQAIGESECTALALYRGNLACYTPSSLQIWQVDPDPSRMVFLDAVDGVGTLVSRGHASVSGDLYFLAQLGVRSVSIAAGTANMAAGDIGTPIDPLVRADLAAFTGEPLGIYLTSAGQYWLILGDHAWVFTYSPSAQIAAWSRYTFAWTVTDACVLGGELYLRDTGNRLLKMDATAEQLARPVQDAGANFPVVVRWPFLDFGGPNGNLRTLGFDVLYTEGSAAAATNASLAVGYDENSIATLTDAVVVLPDARAEDGFVPLELTAPSISPQVTYTGPNAWELTQVNVYVSGSWRTP